MSDWDELEVKVIGEEKVKELRGQFTKKCLLNECGKDLDQKIPLSLMIGSSASEEEGILWNSCHLKICLVNT